MSDIDYHKLQETLFNLDPSDPREDLAALQTAAGNPDAPKPAQTVNESTPESRQPLDEVAQLAALAGAEKQQSAPMSDEAAQMAALAGITLNEGQKTGRAGQVKGSEGVSSSSKPSKDGEQEHPFKDRLVGDDSEMPRENSDEDLEEGPKLDRYKKAKADYNNPNAFKGVAKNSKKKAAKGQQTQQKEQLSPKMQQMLNPYANELAVVFRNKNLKAKFEQLMKEATKSYRAEDLENDVPEINESKSPIVENKDQVKSIKSDLMRRLNSRR